MLFISYPPPVGGGGADVDLTDYYTKTEINNLIRGIGTAYTVPATDGTNGFVLKTNGSGVTNWQQDNISGGTGGDNMGDCSATQNIKLGTFWLSGDGGNEGVYVGTDGNVGIGTSSTESI